VVDSCLGQAIPGTGGVVAEEPGMVRGLSERRFRSATSTRLLPSDATQRTPHTHVAIC
jgi:hypothetical protein